MPIADLELNAIYLLADDRQGAATRETSEDRDGTPWLEVVFAEGEIVTYDCLPKRQFMQMAIRKLEDPPNSEHPRP